ncbi:MAG: DUF1028 domain-containing protein [Actinomycetota bacterium]
MGASVRFVRRLRAGAALLIVACVVLVLVEPAAATWSIVAVDDDTGEVGAGIASCVPYEVIGNPDEPAVPVILDPGRAAAVTQAQLDIEAPARIRQFLAANAGAAAIVGELIDPDTDELASVRQHAVVRRPAETAAHTGADNDPVALDRQGEGVSVQGNLLASEAVVSDTLATFEAQMAADGDLAGALAAALAAGGEAGGDNRCGDQAALFAQVAVATPTDAGDAPSTLLTVTVSEGDGQDPSALLLAAFERGERGLIAAGEPTASGGGVVRVLVLVGGVLLVVGAAVALRRGMGSISARR